LFNITSLQTLIHSGVESGKELCLAWGAGHRFPERKTGFYQPS
jgi:hypothetical protein